MDDAKQDILVDISDDDLPELLHMYEKHKDWAPHAYSTIATGIEWRKKRKEKYMTFMSPHGCWREDGTFFALLAHSCFDIFVFSLDDSGKNIYEGILKSNRLSPGKFKGREPWFYAVHNKFYPIVTKAIKDKGLTSTAEIPCHMFSVPSEEALMFDIECPYDVYIKALDSSYSQLISSLWPFGYKGAQKFIELLLEMNGGFGVFLKSTDQLVSWVLLSMMGQLVILQTAEGHKKKGYASLITKYASRKLAQKGHSAFGTAAFGNFSSKGMFEKIGFKNLGVGTYIPYINNTSEDVEIILL